jgi:tRNA threonylcarbamoyl adenosine modification protein (Sua5/YciO/YrdC/YwlC family)
MLVKVYENNPGSTVIRKIVEVIRNRGIIILPTDTVYAFGCDIFNSQGIEFISKLKNKNLKKSNLSFICENLSQVSEYAKIDDSVFKLLKNNLPGPFTFILNGNSNLPKMFKNKKTVGVRIPQNNISLEIVRELGNPLMTSSVFIDDEDAATNPELLNETYGQTVDLVIDGGMGSVIPSTIVNCTGDEIAIIREGAGVLLE